MALVAGAGFLEAGTAFFAMTALLATAFCFFGTTFLGLPADLDAVTCAFGAAD